MVNPEDMAPGSEPKVAAATEAVAGIRAEFERIGVSYSRAGAGTYVAVLDLGDEVLLKGPPRSGLFWQGTHDEALARVRAIPSDVDPPGFWEALRGGR